MSYNGSENLVWKMLDGTKAGVEEIDLVFNYMEY
jgi:hypothetical protein